MSESSRKKIKVCLISIRDFLQQFQEKKNSNDDYLVFKHEIVHNLRFLLIIVEKLEERIQGDDEEKKDQMRDFLESVESLIQNLTFILTDEAISDIFEERLHSIVSNEQTILRSDADELLTKLITKINDLLTILS